MKISECMCKDVCFVKPDCNVYDAARIMNENHIGCIPVCDDNKCIVGLLTDRDINWNDLPTHLKRGSCCVKIYPSNENDTENKARPYWHIDTDIPIFKDEGREYIEKLINVW